MGLFDIFKKSNYTTENGILGPAYLDGLTENIPNPKGLEKFEWRRKLKSPSGQTKFKIKYYGKPHDEYPNLIVQTDFAPALVFAIDSSSEQEILLFDGCKHGYNAMFCDAYTKDQVEHRPVNDFFKDKKGSDTFEVIFSAYYQIDYNDPEEEFAEQVDKNGFIELLDGSKVEFDKVKRNGFDVLRIFVINEHGQTFEIISEELA